MARFRENPYRRWRSDNGPEQLRRELAPLLSGRTEWPTEREWREAGAYHLLRAVQRLNGTRYWAQEFGLPYRPRGRPAGQKKWSDKRIEDELVAYYAERSSRGDPPWPQSKDQWLDDGRASLYRALARNGGVRAWRERTAQHRACLAGSLPCADPSKQRRADNAGAIAEVRTGQIWIQREGPARLLIVSVGGDGTAQAVQIQSGQRMVHPVDLDVLVERFDREG